MIKVYYLFYMRQMRSKCSQYLYSSLYAGIDKNYYRRRKLWHIISLGNIVVASTQAPFLFCLSKCFVMGLMLSQ